MRSKTLGPGRRWALPAAQCLLAAALALMPLMHPAPAQSRGGRGGGRAGGGASRSTGRAGGVSTSRGNVSANRSYGGYRGGGYYGGYRGYHGGGYYRGYGGYYGGGYYRGYGGYYGGGYYGGYGGYYPVAAAVGTALVVGAIVSTLPATNCTTVVVNGIGYSQCGTTWYQPVYQGSDVVYQVVNAPQ